AETLSPVGPRKHGQSWPLLRVRRSGGGESPGRAATRSSSSRAAVALTVADEPQPAVARQDRIKSRRIARPPSWARTFLYITVAAARGDVCLKVPKRSRGASWFRPVEGEFHLPNAGPPDGQRVAARQEAGHHWLPPLSPQGEPLHAGHRVPELDGPV